MNIDRILPRWQILGYALGGGLIILLCFGLVYRPVWTAVNQPTLFPWGSDTLGHLLRYEYIRQNIQAGEWYPQIMPEWYMGMQLLRYYAPLPYYCIYLFEGLLGSSMAAMHGFILFWTVFGGLSWLLFRRFIGAAPAVLSGVIYILLPDLIRVAFSEGNLPRVMAAGLTPLLLFLTLSLVKTGGSRMERAGLALLFTIITLTHAMMAAIYAAALIFMVGLLWLFQTTSWRNAYQVVVWISLGIGAAGFWLLPSLTGGITELESGAVNRGFDVIAWADFLNPGKRLDSIESVYVSLSLLVAALACLIVPWTRNRLLSAAGASGIILALLVTPQLTALFSALPLSALLWPVRFLGIASCFLLFVFTASLNGWWSKSKPVTLLLVGLVLVDCGISSRLIFLRSLNPDLAKVSQSMTAHTGWREATLDESRLGSAASWLFTSQAHREQVFGWGYQGARTARNVASLNDALASGSTGYLVDRLTLFGVDDLVVLDSLPNAKELKYTLPQSDFTLIQRSGEISYYHRDGKPRAVTTPWQALGIGPGAQTFAYLFPQVVLGDSPYLDDYSSSELTRFPVLILAGFQWHDRADAEEAVRNAARHGVRVFVDLTRIPVDPLSQIPRFLDVWGETITMAAEPLEVTGWEEPLRTTTFGSANELWHTFILQNVQHEVVGFDYLGKLAVLAGYNQYESGKVWFIGANLAYHALTARDDAAINFLAELIEIPAGQPAAYQAVTLEAYKAGSRGYSFGYNLDRPEELLIPVAALDGTTLRLDGQAWPLAGFENLVAFSAPAGRHQVEILYQPTRIYRLGFLVTILSVIVIAALSVPRKFSRKRSDHLLHEN